MAVAVAVLIAAGIGVLLHDGDRSAGETWHSIGSAEPDRIDVLATVQKVDAATRELVLRVLVAPRGSLGEDDAPAADLRVATSSSLRGDLVLPARQRIASVDVPLVLSGGPVTDYPFDRYRTQIEFAATSAGRPVPVLLTLDRVDTLFSLDVTGYGDQSGNGLDVTVSRSVSTVVFSVFMMLTMWGLAIAVVLGASRLVAHRAGPTWPAYGFMAATLFALVGFRNAAPGAPPFGSLIDYVAFLWAELVIALTVVASVAAGVRNDARAS